MLKVIKHCTESLPRSVAGSLLGLDVGRTLEVTNCFPFPSDDSTDTSGHDYQMDMMRMLREMNVDHNQVGWYQSAFLGTFCRKDLVATQVEFQETFGQKAVVVIFDPYKSTHGSLSIQAFRLTAGFLEAHRAGRFSLSSVEGLDMAASGIFEEVPIRIRNAHLFRGLLYEMAEESSKEVDAEIDRLDLSSNPFLEMSLQYLTERVGDLNETQRELQYWEAKVVTQREKQAAWLADRRAENESRIARGLEPKPEEDPSNPLFAPITPKVDRLDALLVTAQIGKYCEQINKFAGQSFSKLFLTGSLHKE